MNNQNKQKSEQEIQANKILYITVAAMLVIMAVVVILSSVLSRAKPGVDTDGLSDTNAPSSPAYTEPPATQPNTPSDKLPVIADPDTEEEVVNPTPDKPTIPTLASPVAAGILSKEYSDSTLVYSTTMEDYRAHVGIDINAKLGDPVLAAADGTVADIWYDPMTGQCLKIEHEGSLVSIYRNLSDTLAEGVKVGGSVKCGDTVGYIGESSIVEIAQEPHLHFEAELSGKKVDPTDYLSVEAKSQLLQDTSYED